LRISKIPYIRIKTRWRTIEITPHDFIAAIIIISLLLNFWLLVSGRIEAADRFAAFFGGYGVGALIQQILTMYLGRRGENAKAKKPRTRKPQGAS